MSTKAAFAACAILCCASGDVLAMAMCKLPTARCRIVLDEMRRAGAQDLHDYEMLTGLRPYQRRLAVIERSAQRLKLRLRDLPQDVGDEVARLTLCDAIDREAGARGAFNNDPRCR